MECPFRHFIKHLVGRDETPHKLKIKARQDHTKVIISSKLLMPNPS